MFEDIRILGTFDLIVSPYGASEFPTLGITRCKLTLAISSFETILKEQI